MKVRKLIAITHLSLDGVMQGPGGPEEDPRGGFTHGGWGMLFDDDLVPKQLEKLMAGKFDLLLGRRTYDIFAGYWPRHADNFIGQAFDRAAKYVVTRGSRPLPWQGSVRVGGGGGKAVEAVRRLKKTEGPDLHVWGSGNLLQTLIQAKLVDEHQIWVYPAVLGYGKRLFEPGTPPQRMKLVESKAGSGGVVVNTYRPDGALPSTPMARIKAKQAAARKAAAAGPGNVRIRKSRSSS
jgi:dihydrofolate reductase